MISGDLLREARRRAGLSQAELARRSGKATSVIGRWERGEVKPSLETLRSVIRAAGFDLELGIRERNDARAALIEAFLDLTPQQRFDQLESWAEFISEARANLVEQRG